MRRHLLVPALAVGAVLLLAAPVSAKGPTEATVDGGGMAAPLDLMDELGPTGFWDVADDLGYVSAVGSPRDDTVAAPTDPGPMVTVTFAGPQSPTEDFDVTVELYPWAAEGARLHVLPGQTSITNAPTDDEWFAVPQEAVTVLRSLGLPSRAELAAAQRPAPGSGTDPAPLQVDAPDAGFSWPTVLTVAALGLGALGLAAGLRRRASSARAVTASA